MTIKISFSEKTVRVAVEINGAIESKITELPQRPWVGLTDEDMGFLFPHGKSEWVQETVKIIEAKLRSKNT
jgi:hypothetical protein